MDIETPTSSDSSIAGLIAAEGGRMTFGRFMEVALTHPTQGYYSRADRLLRHGGDFNTAPALSPFFNQTVANLVTELVDAALEAAPAAKPCVVELGGGEGQLAGAILGFWERERPHLRERLGYRIVEVGARLRERQAEAAAVFVAAGWEVGWGGGLREACAGSQPVVIVGNEFLDAQPVCLVDVSGAGLRELYVASDGAELAETWAEVSASAAVEMERLFGTLDPRRLAALTADGLIEVRPGLEDLLRDVAVVMPAGSFVTVDYGDWFAGVGPAQADCACGPGGRPPRRRTLRGYFRHQLTRDPLARPGRQDLTADVDFAAVDLHGRLMGFETVAFTTLAAFLRGGGAEEALRRLRAAAASVADPLEVDRQATVLQNLLDEEDLGGAFKVMVQVRD